MKIRVLVVPVSFFYIDDNSMKVTIKEREIALKYSFRALMIYENITQKSFNPQGLTDVITFFYSVVVASARDMALSFDDFLDWIDDNPSSLNDFSQWLTDVYNHQIGITNKEVADEAKTDEGDTGKN